MVFDEKGPLSIYMFRPIHLGLSIIHLVLCSIRVYTLVMCAYSIPCVLKVLWERDFYGIPL